MKGWGYVYVYVYIQFLYSWLVFLAVLRTILDLYKTKNNKNRERKKKWFVVVLIELFRSYWVVVVSVWVRVYRSSRLIEQAIFLFCFLCFQVLDWPLIVLDSFNCRLLLNRCRKRLNVHKSDWTWTSAQAFSPIQANVLCNNTRTHRIYLSIYVGLKSRMGPNAYM